jgi:tetratricopeptide (TPR) repeat protein
MSWWRFNRPAADAGRVLREKRPGFRVLAVWIILVSVIPTVAAQVPTAADYERLMVQRSFANHADDLDFKGMLVSASVDNIIAASTALIQRATIDREALAFVYAKRAAALYSKRADEEAIHDYDKALELSSEGAGFIHVEAAVRLFKRYRDRAMEHFAKAIAFNAQDPYPYFWRGRSHQEVNELDLAIRDFDQVIELAPQRASAYVWRGDAYRAQGNVQRALSDYRAAFGLADRSVVKSAQYALREQGFYRGPEDGQNSPDFHDAVAACVRDPACKSVVQYWSRDTPGDRP